MGMQAPLQVFDAWSVQSFCRHPPCLGWSLAQAHFKRVIVLSRRLSTNFRLGIIFLGGEVVCVCVWKGVGSSNRYGK